MKECYYYNTEILNMLEIQLRAIVLSYIAVFQVFFRLSYIVNLLYTSYFRGFFG